MHVTTNPNIKMLIQFCEFRSMKIAKMALKIYIQKKCIEIFQRWCRTNDYILRITQTYPSKNR